MVMMAGGTVTGTKRNVLVACSDIWILPAGADKRETNKKSDRGHVPSVRAIK